MRVRQYCFKQQTEFPILTKLVGPLLSNIKDSLTKSAVSLPLTVMRSIRPTFMFLTPENADT